MRFIWRLALFAACVSFPFATYASDALHAGFAPTSLWLSKTALTDGDTATLYAVLYNSGDATLTGDLTFADNGAALSTKHVDIAPGSTEIESAPWTARAGAHTFTATLSNTPALSDASTGSVAVTVAAPSPPSPTEKAASSALSAVPALQSAVSKAYDAAESVRTGGAAAIEGALADVETPEGSVLGTSTSRVAAAKAATPAKAPGLMASAERGALSGLLFIFDSRLWFYILLVIVLYLLYKLVRVLFSSRRRR
jgi:hypothetical protein